MSPGKKGILFRISSIASFITPCYLHPSMSVQLRIPFLAALLVMLLLASLSAGCTSGQSPAQPAGATPVPPASANAITIKNFAFSPATITVKTGTTVTWTNEDSAPHEIASDAGSPIAFTSTQLATGASFSQSFAQVGTYPYHCAIHPSMKGTVVVQS
jgi:plastocyanin